MSTTEITVIDKRNASQVEVVPVPTMSQSGAIMTLIERAALDPNFNVEKLTALFELKKAVDAEEAKKAYVEAMTAFKAEQVTISKNKRVHFTSQKGTTDYVHATLDNVCAVIGAAMSRHGLSYRWETKQTESMVRVTCIVSHRLGHSERTMLFCPPDNTGNKNSIQAVGSAVTYLQRYTLLALTGLATSEQDDDGRATTAPSGMDAMELGDWLDGIAQAETLPKLQNLYTDAMKAAQKAKDQGAQKEIIAAKDARKKELSCQ